MVNNSLEKLQGPKQWFSKCSLQTSRIDIT